MRYLPFLILIVVVTATAPAQPGDNHALGQALELDAESGARVYRLGGDERPADNIYGEQPYGDEKPTLVNEGKRFGHVSVSRDGKYWIGDTGQQGIPIYVGSFATGRAQRVCFSRTEYDNQQWSHAHPYLTADSQWLIFAARRNGHPQVYGAKLKDGWLEKL